MSREYGKRDPSSHRTPEQIKKMDRGYNHRPDIIKDRSQRNQARSIVRKDLGEAAIRGKDVDHKRMVKDGGSNARSNLRVRSEHANRGWNRKKR
ncbi:HNH endonuclease [Bradyrhizobium cenepequi]